MVAIRESPPGSHPNECERSFDAAPCDFLRRFSEEDDRITGQISRKMRFSPEIKKKIGGRKRLALSAEERNPSMLFRCPFTESECFRKGCRQVRFLVIGTRPFILVLISSKHHCIIPSGRRDDGARGLRSILLSECRTFPPVDSFLTSFDRHEKLAHGWGTFV